MGGPVVGARPCTRVEFRTGLEARRKPGHLCAHQPGTGKVFPCPGRAGLENEPGQVNTMVRVGGGGSQSQVAELHHTFTASDLNPPVGDPASEPALRACVACVHPHTHSQVSRVRAIAIASRACVRVACCGWEGSRHGNGGT